MKVVISRGFESRRTPMNKVIYIPIESMTQKEYERWIKDGGEPTKEKWILDKIKENTDGEEVLLHLIKTKYNTWMSHKLPHLPQPYYCPVCVGVIKEDIVKEYNEMFSSSNG